jgi:putative DNA primase/helicase
MNSRAADLAQALADQIETVCIALDLGAFTRAGDQNRFRSKGSLCVWISGPSRGRFSDFEAGAHGDALDLVRHIRGGSMADAMRWADGFLGSPQRPLGSPPAREKAKPHPTPSDDKERNRRRAESLWREAGPIGGTVAQAYLTRRCGALPRHSLSHALRFHPAAYTQGRRWPCLVALMTDPATNEPVAVHRTFLTPDAHKAAPGKSMLGGKGVIRLWPDDTVGGGLFIAEGIETALAAAHLFSLAPVWATGDAGNMADFPLLDGIEELTALADQDASGGGERAAHAVTDRYAAAGRFAGIIIPKTLGDMADLLEGGRHDAA